MVYLTVPNGSAYCNNGTIQLQGPISNLACEEAGGFTHGYVIAVQQGESPNYYQTFDAVPYDYLTLLFIALFGVLCINAISLRR